MVELWGIMGNGGVIMGNYGELWGVMGNYGGIMGNDGELWDVICCVADGCFLSSYGSLLPQTCQTFIFATMFPIIPHNSP